MTKEKLFTKIKHLRAAIFYLLAFSYTIFYFATDNEHYMIAAWILIGIAEIMFYNYKERIG